jgi:putative addiction module component (TIGR02574 family)
MKHLREILSLPVNERIHLVETIWDSIALETSQNDLLTPAQLKDLIERNADFEKNPNEGVSWETAKRQIRSGKWRTL